MALVVVIALAWMVILGPGLMKRRSQSGDGISSISHFHHQLRVLEHSGAQPIVRPAYRLRGRPVPAGTDDGPWTGDPAPRPVLTVVGADRLPRPALAFLGADPVEDASGRPAHRRPEPGIRLPGTGGTEGPTPRVAGIGPAPGDSAARHLARRRRRGTLGILAMVFVASGMLGFVPGASAAWSVTAVSGVALVAYVALLVHLRRKAEERERKLHYLEPRTAVGRGGDRPAPSYLGGRYAHPSNQAVAAH
ncbi:MAG TPA: hypothetical protein VMV06_01490 [Acidimicrobiales bacterium]|nr:hypothetical protein [Acidimicrobiales bacterium]